MAKHYLFRGFSLVCSGMIQQAVVDIDIALSLSKNLADALLLKGKCVYVAGDFDAALKCYEQLQNAHPEEAVSHFHMGNLLMLNGDFESAIRHYKTSLEVEENANSYYQLAKCLILLEKQEEALTELAQAIKLKPVPVFARDLKSLQVFHKEVSKAEVEQLFSELLKKARKKDVVSYELGFETNGESDYCRLEMESMYKFPIFEVEDWIAYRAAMRLYMGKNKEALEDFNELHDILLAKKRKYFESQEGLNVEMANFESEINNLRFSPMTLNECRYNLTICHLLVRFDLTIVWTV